MARQAPAWLKAQAKAGSVAATEACQFWTEHASALEKMGRLTALDYPAFTRLAVSYGLMSEASRVLMQDGLTIVATERGKDVEKRHPAALVYQTQEMIVRQGFAEFGLTPSARSKMRPGNDADTPDSPEHSGEGILD